jgi:hypothetical protein
MISRKIKKRLISFFNSIKKKYKKDPFGFLMPVIFQIWGLIQLGKFFVQFLTYYDDKFLCPTNSNYVNADSAAKVHEMSRETVRPRKNKKKLGTVDFEQTLNGTSGHQTNRPNITTSSDLKIQLELPLRPEFDFNIKSFQILKMPIFVIENRLNAPLLMIMPLKSRE